MIIHVLNPQIRQVLQFVINKSGAEKRILSPDPENEPYWHHLVRVYEYLLRNGESNKDILLGALLHDSFEDGHLTLEEIGIKFGAKVKQIVALLSEDDHTDHNITNKRDAYFKRIVENQDMDVKYAAMKIKVADRYDNLLGLSFTNLNKKKTQYLDEIDKYLRNFSKEVKLEELLEEGVKVLKGEKVCPDLSVSVVM